MESRSTAPWVRSSWFLTTAPQPLPGIAARERLVSWLSNTFETSPLALIAAPSGYGKTVLLSSFTHASTTPVAWLTLTHHEQHNERLILLGILASLQRRSAARAATPGLGQLDLFSQSAETRDLYGRIAAAVAELPEPVVLVIDDAHHAGAILGEIIEVLLRLTDYRTRFAVAGRTELVPWFTKPLTANPKILITAAGLALTVPEVLNDAALHGEQLDRSSAEARRRATAGWPIAFQMHQLAAGRDTADTAWQETLFVDFIDSEVLPALPDRIRDFVLAATTCNRLNPVLASALSGHADAAALLEECVSSGLFLERFIDGNERIVYRWHDAFADACRRIVARNDAQHSRALHTIAAQKLTGLFPAEALLHAAQSDDAELTLAIIRAAWIRMLLESGARALQTSCLSLPDEYAEHPEVLVVRACCLNLLDDRAGGQMLAARAVAHGAGSEDFTVTYAFAQLFLLDDQDELAAATDAAQRLLATGESEPTLHAYRVFLVGWTLLRLRRNPEQTIQLLRTAMNEARLLHRPILEKRAASNLLFALSFAGKFAAADGLLNSTLAAEQSDDDWEHYDGGIGLFAVGFGAFWRGEFDQAAATLRVLAGNGGHNVSYAALARVFLALIAAADKNPNDLAAAQAQVGEIGRTETHGIPWQVYGAIARAALLAAQNQPVRALETIAPLRSEQNVPIVRVIAAEIARQAGDPGMAMDFLAKLTPLERSLSYVAASAETTAALIAAERGDTAQAQLRLERALDIADAEDLLQPFRSTDPQLRKLLAAHAVSGSKHAEFIAARLATLEHSADAAFGVALSEREREVLGYLRTPMTASEIAAALFVSVNTVRTHQRAIYRKLGVSSRREAVKLRP